MYPSMHWAGGCVSQHALGRGVCIPACTGQGVVCPGGCLNRRVSARGVSAEGMCLPQCMLGYTHPLVDRILDTCLWKHYLSATSFADGNNKYTVETRQKEMYLTYQLLLVRPVSNCFITHENIWHAQLLHVFYFILLIYIIFAKYSVGLPLK